MLYLGSRRVVGTTEGGGIPPFWGIGGHPFRDLNGDTFGGESQLPFAYLGVAAQGLNVCQAWARVRRD